MTESQIAEVVRLVAVQAGCDVATSRNYVSKLERGVITCPYLPQHAGHRDARPAMAGADHDRSDAFDETIVTIPVTMH